MGSSPITTLLIMFYFFAFIFCLYFFKFLNFKKSYFNFFYVYKRLYKYFDFSFISIFSKKVGLQRIYNYFHFFNSGLFFVGLYPFFNVFGFNFCFVHFNSVKPVFYVTAPISYYTFGFFFIFFYPNYKIFNISNKHFIYLLLLGGGG